MILRSAVVLAAVAGLASAHDDDDHQNSTDRHADGRGNQAQFAQPHVGGASTNGINYHGGPLLTNGVNIYYIWYGNWSANTAVQILDDLANSIGGSPYFNINTTYYNGAGVHVLNAAHLAGQTNIIGYPYGTSLSDSQIAQVVVSALNGTNVTAQLPIDANGVYFVLTSQDVTASSGFCTKYCGWHTYGLLSNGTAIKYAFIGNPARCPTNCAASQIQSKPPNGNLGADGMASILSHELEEATTDPQLNAWYDRTGAENADKCAWKFGTTYTTASGATANMKLGTRDFLIQQNWVNASGGFCALAK
jgi:hypothetical protein